MGKTKMDFISAGASLFGTFTVIVGGVISHVHLRMRQLETRIQVIATEIRAAQVANNDKLWTALEQHRRDSAQFQQVVLTTMATKDDVRHLVDSMTRNPRADQ